MSSVFRLHFLGFFPAVVFYVFNSFFGSVQRVFRDPLKADFQNKFVVFCAVFLFSIYISIKAHTTTSFTLAHVTAGYKKGTYYFGMIIFGAICFMRLTWGHLFDKDFSVF